MQENFGGVVPDGGQVQPGQPAFTLVSKITPEDHARALADAFLKAKCKLETAKAAGVRLGLLRRHKLSDR